MAELSRFLRSMNKKIYTQIQMTQSNNPKASAVPEHSNVHEKKEKNFQLWDFDVVLFFKSKS